jgi:hypothetical protein
VLPTLVLFVDGVAKEHVRGFEFSVGAEKGKEDEFPTAQVRRLSGCRAGCGQEAACRVVALIALCMELCVMAGRVWALRRNVVGSAARHLHGQEGLH